MILLGFRLGGLRPQLDLLTGPEETAIAVRAAAFMRARFVVGGASFLGDAYLPPSEPRRTSTALSVCLLFVRMDFGPALDGLRSRTAIAVSVRCEFVTRVFRLGLA